MHYIFNLLLKLYLQKVYDYTVILVDMVHVHEKLKRNICSTFNSMCNNNISKYKQRSAYQRNTVYVFSGHLVSPSRQSQSCRVPEVFFQLCQGFRNAFSGSVRFILPTMAEYLFTNVIKRRYISKQKGNGRLGISGNNKELPVGLVIKVVGRLVTMVTLLATMGKCAAETKSRS